MKKMKLKSAIRGVLTAGLITACTVAVAVDIVVIAHGQANDPFWSVVKNGVEAAGRSNGVNVDYRSPEAFDMVAMSQLIDGAVNQEPDGLVVSIPDADALSPSIERAVAAGIPVISINSGSDVSKSLGALLHVGQDEYEAGKVAGAWLAQQGGSNAICVNQEVGNVALDLRCQGFSDGFNGKTKVLPTTNDPAEIESKVAAALATDESIDTVMALGAAIAGEPTAAAVKSSGRPVTVASFDLSPNFLKSVVEGDAAFAIDQQQFLQGYLPVSFLALHAKYGLIPSSDVLSGPNLITADKVGQVISLSAKGIR
jgi:simple sugar transport system substrate-binding protein